MPSILVADNIAEGGLERLRSNKQITVDIRVGLTPEKLTAVIGDYHGVLIRSGVRITEETLARPGQLMVIARAGVGVDNVDVEAATDRGILVLNTPDANTLSTAEHAFALMLALYRNLPDAHAHVQSRQWRRRDYLGHQLAGHTLGIIGFGRIGRAVAKRALAFEMKVIAYDPFVSSQTSFNGAVRMTRDLRSLLAEADCVTLHAALTEDTQHLIGAEQLATMKQGARFVNCARGALVDEAALAEALNSNHLGGAAIDVYEHEPPEGSPLLTAQNVVLTPHLAASTAEAQLRVSLDAADALLAYLIHGEIRSAVNVTGMPASLSPRGRAFVDLASRMGTVLSPWFAAGVEQICVTIYSDAMQDLAPTLAMQTMAAVLAPHLDERVNLVNVKDLASQRSIAVEHIAHSLHPTQSESVRVSLRVGGNSHAIEGTVLSDGRPRIVEIDGYRMDLLPAGPMVLIHNEDQPGVIGLVGRKLGEAGVNIADMALSRRSGTALMVLSLDEPMPDALCKALSSMKPPIHNVHRVLLPPISEARGIA